MQIEHDLANFSYEFSRQKINLNLDGMHITSELQSETKYPN